MNNVELSEMLEETALLLEFREGPSFIVEEFSKASERVENFEIPLELFAETSTNDSENESNEEELDRILAFGFGDVLRDVVWNLREMTLTGSSTLRDRLKNEISSSAVELLNLRTLDPQTVGFLREAMNIRNLAALKQACKRGALKRSGRFTPEKERAILAEANALENSDKRDSSVSAKSSDAAFLKKIVESETQQPIDDPNLIFSANAAALSDFIVRTLEDSVKNVAEKNASVSFDPRELTSEENLEIVRDRALGVLGKMRRFFTSRNNPKYARLQMEEEERRRERTRRQIETAKSASPDSYWTRLETVGAVRRRAEGVERFDFLLETTDPTAAFDLIEKESFVKETLTRESRFLAVSLKSDAFALPYNNRPTPEATLRFFAAPNLIFGTRQAILSSTSGHWRALQDRAAKRGWNLTSFGLYSGTRRLSSRMEERLYEKFDLPTIPPELRENRVEWDWIGAGAPKLLTLDELRGDLHLHSRFTDGTAEIDEIVETARKSGLDYIAMTDHTKNVGSVGGMSDDEFLRYWDYIDDLNRKLESSGVDFRVLKGAEVDILESGGLDLTDETLARADWILASIHFGLDQSAERIRSRYSDAFRNPYVDAIAHPTERQIGTDSPMNVDVDFLCESAAKYGKFLELNSQPRRLDLSLDGLIAAKKAGVPIVISTDSHALDQMEYLRFGVEHARRAGLTKADVANAAPLADFLRLRDVRKANASSR